MKIKDAIDTAWNAVKTLKFWKELFVMTFGMAIAALAVNYFLVPGKLIVGSISGLSIVISGIFDLIGTPVKVSTVIVIINAILLILAYLLIDKEFGIKTVYTALILGPLMVQIPQIFSVQKNPEDILWHFLSSNLFPNIPSEMLLYKSNHIVLDHCFS